MPNIFINEKRFEIYIGDIEATVLDRYALSENTLPEYLRELPIGWQIDDNIIIQVENLKEIIKSVKYEDLSEFYAKSIFGKYPDVDRLEFGILWISENDENYKVNINPLQKLSSKDFPNEHAVDRHLQDFKKQWSDRSKNLKKEVEKQNKINNTLQNQKEKGPDIGEFVEERITVKITLKLAPSTSPLNIFDDVTLNKEVPFIAIYLNPTLTIEDSDDVKRYYKVFEDTIPNPEWAEELNTSQAPETIVFKLLRSQIRKDLYTNVIWYPQDPETHECAIEYAYGVRERLGMQQIRDAILQTLSIPVDVIKSENVSIRGKITVDNFQVDNLVLLDMITNNKVVSNYLMVKEYNPPRKGKGLIHQMADLKQRFFVYWWPRALSSFLDSFSFTINTITDDNNPYINFHISRIKTHVEINRFRAFLSSLLGYYKSRRNRIIGEYQRNVADFSIERRIKASSEGITKYKVNQLRSNAPTLFVDKYPSICAAKRQPTIINEDEAAEEPYEKKMLFPKDGSNRDWYICKDDVYQYPGLIVNKKLGNREDYPLLPCCFTQNQYVGKKAKLRLYMSNVAIVPNKATVSDTIIGPGKFPRVYQQGELPFNIQRAFSLFYDENISKRIVRIAVPRGCNTFIHACLQATNTTYRGMNYEEQLKKASTDRKRFVNLNVLQGAQELFNKSRDDIKAIILDEDEPFSAIEFIRLAEIIYRVNIFLFSYSIDDIQGSILIPAHDQAYLVQRTSYQKSIFIIVHSEGCEVIGDRKMTTNQYLFSEEIAKGIESIFKESYNVSMISKSQITDYSPQVSKLLFIRDASKQYIDENGKVRALIYNDGMYISVSPLPPLRKKEVVIIAPSGNVQWEIAKSFINKYEFTIVGKNEEGILLNLPIPYGFIHTQTASEKLMFYPRLSRSFRDSLVPARDSLLQKFRDNKKLALYLREYILFLYSNFPSEEFEDRVVIAPRGHDYTLGITGTLTLNNKLFIRRDKLLVPSIDSKSKLLYYLKTMLFNQYAKVMEYKNRTLITGEYDSISDFIQRRGELIFLNPLSLLEWISRIINKIPINKVQTEINFRTARPFFFSSPNLVGGKIVIVQNVSGGELKKALNVSAIWIQKKYNLGYYSDSIGGDISYVKWSLTEPEQFHQGITTSSANVLVHPDGSTYSALIII